LVVLSGGGWAYFTHQRAGRQAATERVVGEAIEKATLLRGQAKAAPVGDLLKWGEALTAASHAKALLQAGEPSDPLRVRVVQLLDALEREQDKASRQATEKDKDRKLFERLEAIRLGFADKDASQFGFADENTAAKADAAYAAAWQSR
jgi:hypothetical protein